MENTLRVVLVVLGVVSVLMLTKVLIVIHEPDSRLGEYNKTGRFVLVSALAILTMAATVELYFRIGTPLTWRTPALGAGVCAALVGTYFTFYGPEEK
jgi:hypothetical protein